MLNDNNNVNFFYHIFFVAKQNIRFSKAYFRNTFL